MAIRDVVLHQGPDARSRARLDVAVALAKAHDARVTGVFVKVDPGAPASWRMPFAREEIAEWLGTLDRMSGEAEETFETRLAEEGLEGHWRVMAGDPTEAMIACARHGDLTVIGQTSRDEPDYAVPMPDQLVLGAGAPVLIVPYAGRLEAIGARVLVAWDGGREASRAVRDALPILERATKVVVHRVKPPDTGHWAGADVCAYLARHGVPVAASHAALGPEAETVSPVLQTVGGFGFQQPGPWKESRHPALGEADVGDALLSAAADCAADLLVMGAYGRSRIREIVLGGTTRQILATMTLPVLMSH